MCYFSLAEVYMFVIASVDPEVIAFVPMLLGVISEGTFEQVKTIISNIAIEEKCEVTETGVVVISPRNHLYVIEVPSIDQVQLRKAIKGFKSLQELFL
jgi:hypothetical protein